MKYTILFILLAVGFQSIAQTTEWKVDGKTIHVHRTTEKTIQEIAKQKGSEIAIQTNLFERFLRRLKTKAENRAVLTQNDINQLNRQVDKTTKLGIDIGNYTEEINWYKSVVGKKDAIGVSPELMKKRALEYYSVKKYKKALGWFMKYRNVAPNDKSIIEDRVISSIQFVYKTDTRKLDNNIPFITPELLKLTENDFKHVINTKPKFRFNRGAYYYHLSNIFPEQKQHYHKLAVADIKAFESSGGKHEKLQDYKRYLEL